MWGVWADAEEEEHEDEGGVGMRGVMDAAKKTRSSILSVWFMAVVGFYFCRQECSERFVLDARVRVGGFIFVGVENMSRPGREWKWGRECLYWRLDTQVGKDSFKKCTVL